MKMLRFIMVVALMLGSHFMTAQTIYGVEYMGEIQSDFKGGFNFPNLLRLDLETSSWNHLSFEAASIGIAKTSKDRLVDDLQTFSNIEEDNLPFALAKFGLNWAISDNHSLFLGVQNVNEDYFTSPVTSLFTGSSCGIFPTISCNFPIANYPVSSMGLHYAFESDNWQILASLYNGVGYTRILGKGSIFGFRPVSDGAFLIGQCGFTGKGSRYYLGGCFHSGSEVVGMGGSVWGYAEQSITDRLSLIADLSYALGKEVPCRNFAAVGIRYETGRVELGAITDYARFRENYELATEITCLYKVNEHVGLQPAMHIIRQKDMHAAIGLLRLIVSL